MTDPADVRSIAHRAWFFRAIKFALSVLALCFIFFWVDPRSAWKDFVGQKPIFLVAAIAIFTIQIGLGAIRWHAILIQLGVRISAVRSLKLFYISAFFNSYLWGGIGGDALRVWLLYADNVSGRIALNSVLLDRVAAVTAVAILVLLTAPIYLWQLGGAWNMIVPVGVAVAAIAGLLVVINLDRIPASWRNVRLLSYLQTLGAAARMLFSQPKAARYVIGFAIIAQVALGLATYAVASGLGIAVSAFDCLVLVQPVTLVTILPISIGGWGVRETAMVLLFGLIGVPASSALVLSVQMGLLAMLVVLPGGVLWLLLNPTDRSNAAAGTKVTLSGEETTCS